ncbi:hypothetical protein CXB51_026907 [Gossypium anomalum]|uniref:PX domain-containing protein n=1 Tax=Gossypium anomalum TaxID=47600 RepID=A0A8J5YT03_9ROSI|nr:hypothetical protein CXB51_026907 [Gossypium anomalum]
MNLYAHDLSLFDFTNFSDNPIIDHPSSFASFITTPPSDSGDVDAGNKPTSTANPKSPPKHRHDRTSPLPLGMDWSLPPSRWDGRDTVWPHNPQTGWSYCVTIPSWIILPTSGGSDIVVVMLTRPLANGNALVLQPLQGLGQPGLFYRVQVGIQSPEGVTTTREILRRFSDFLKLLSELKKIFPKKNLPPAPPKRILRVKNRTLLEERRCSLEDWMEKLLSDIDISRSVSVATFLELEAAARSCRCYLDAPSFDNNQPDAVSSVGSVAPLFLSKNYLDIDNASDLDNASSEISELGTPRQGKDGSAGPSMEHSILEPNLIEPLQKSMKKKVHSGRESDIAGDKVTENNTDRRFLRGDGAEHLPEPDHGKMDGHVRRLSIESIGSDLSSVRASEISNLGIASLFGDGLHDLPESAEASRTLDSLSPDLQFHKDLLILFLSDERHKLKRVLNTLQRRLATANTDMEDLISRLNQEVAVRQFLVTKVKDLEVELETTRENCDENMQQAVLLERERFTQMQWDMELLRNQCLEMELKLKKEQDEKAHVESAKLLLMKESKTLLQELDVAREQLADLQKHHEELEVKSKADVKLLVKEVKSLRSSQSELKQELSRVMKEKLELEINWLYILSKRQALDKVFIFGPVKPGFIFLRLGQGLSFPIGLALPGPWTPQLVVSVRVMQKEKKRMEHANAANTKLLHECNLLWDRLQECSVNFLSEEEDKLNVDTSSPSDALDLLTTSDNRIGLLLAEAQLLAQDVENSVVRSEESHKMKDGDKRIDDELRKMLTDMFVDNARLRKQVNSAVRCALNAYVKTDEDDDDDSSEVEEVEEEEETHLRKTVLSKFL